MLCYNSFAYLLIERARFKLKGSNKRFMNNKKILYSVGAFATVTAPITAIIACSSHSKEITPKYLAEKFNNKISKISTSDKKITEIPEEKVGKEINNSKEELGIELPKPSLDFKNKIFLKQIQPDGIVVKSFLTYKVDTIEQESFNPIEWKIQTKTLNNEEALGYVSGKVINDKIRTTKPLIEAASLPEDNKEVTQSQLGVSFKLPLDVKVKTISMISKGKEETGKGSVKVKLTLQKGDKTLDKNVTIFGFKESDYNKNEKDVNKIVNQIVKQTKSSLSIEEMPDVSDNIVTAEKLGITIPKDEDLKSVEVKLFVVNKSDDFITVKVNAVKGTLDLEKFELTLTFNITSFANLKEQYKKDVKAVIAELKTKKTSIKTVEQVKVSATDKQDLEYLGIELEDTKKTKINLKITNLNPETRVAKVIYTVSKGVKDNFYQEDTIVEVTLSESNIANKKDVEDVIEELKTKTTSSKTADEIEVEKTKKVNLDFLGISLSDTKGTTIEAEIKNIDSKTGVAEIFYTVSKGTQDQPNYFVTTATVSVIFVKSS